MCLEDSLIIISFDRSRRKNSTLYFFWKSRDYSTQIETEHSKYYYVGNSKGEGGLIYLAYIFEDGLSEKF